MYKYIFTFVYPHTSRSPSPRSPGRPSPRPQWRKQTQARAARSASGQPPRRRWLGGPNSAGTPPPSQYSPSMFRYMLLYDDYELVYPVGINIFHIGYSLFHIDGAGPGARLDLNQIFNIMKVYFLYVCNPQYHLWFCSSEHLSNFRHAFSCKVYFCRFFFCMMFCDYAYL